MCIRQRFVIPCYVSLTDDRIVSEFLHRLYRTISGLVRKLHKLGVPRILSIPVWLVGCVYVPSTARSLIKKLETAPPLTVPYEGHKARFYTVPTGNRAPGRRVAVHYTTAAPRQLYFQSLSCTKHLFLFDLLQY